MKRFVLSLLGLMALLLSYAPPAQAQMPYLQWLCVAPSAARPSGGYCPVNSTYPLPGVIVSPLPTGSNVIGNVGISSPIVLGSQYPSGFFSGPALPITASASTAASSNIATLPGVSGRITYICGFAVSGLGATAATVSTVTVGGTISGSLVYYEPIPAGVTVGLSPLVIMYNPCIPASAANSAITVTVGSPGAGNTNIAVSTSGYQL